MKLWRSILIFLSVLGPSVITTMAGNDGGGIITYSVAGARLGYAALITLPFLTILYAVTQEMGSRVAVVTGKGLGDLIRERYGVRTAIIVFGLLLVANFGSVLTNASALKVSGQMLGITPWLLMSAVIIGSFLLVTKTEYEKSQKVFLTGMIFYLVYVFSAIKGNPNWQETIRGLFVPTAGMFSKDFLIISIAVLGTTITPWGQFFVQSYMKDKNISVRKLPFARIEAYVGALASGLFTFFIMLATAATLFAHGVGLTSGEQAAMAIRPFAGEFSGILFAVGLVNAAVIGMIIVSLSSAYAFTEFFGFAGSLEDPYSKGKIFYSIFLVNLVLSALLVMTPFFPLFKIVVYTQSLNGILLPVFFFFLLKIINDSQLMGKYTNGKLYNIFAIGASGLIVLAGVLAVGVSLFG